MKNVQNNSKHYFFTSGPWEVSISSGEEGYPKYQIKSKGKWIASILPAWNDTDEANASLIAEAPVLFEVCSDLLHQLSSDSDLDKIAGKDTYQDFTARLQQVIQKVENGIHVNNDDK